MVKRSRSPLFLVLSVLALSAAFTGPVGPVSLSAQKGKVAPGYVMQVLSVPPGATRANVAGINDVHEMVGTVGPSSSLRAVYWSSPDATPVYLPCLTEPCQSIARAINRNGLVSGTANSRAVVWRPNGGEWSVEALPFPEVNDPHYSSAGGGLLDDGTMAGFHALTYGVTWPNDIPVKWSPTGARSEFPVPAGFFSGRAYWVNQDGDATGELRANDGQDPTSLYGGIWIQDGSGYRTLALTSLVSGLTPRLADGSFLVSSTAGRIRVSPSGAYAIESSLDGPGNGINRLGDMVGFLNKKGWTGYGGAPYLLTVDGTLIRLPLPSSATGSASAASTDRWVVGNYLKLGVYYPVVWRPQ